MTISIIFAQICDVASTWGRHLWQRGSWATSGHWREGREQLEQFKDLNHRPGGNQEDEEEVLLLGGGDEPEGSEESQETVARQCDQAERGEKHSLYP